MKTRHANDRFALEMAEQDFSFILCSHLACGYGDVQMGRPVPGN